MGAMNDQMALTIGDVVLSTWLLRLMKIKTEAVRELEIRCQPRTFQITVKANYKQVSGKVSYTLHLLDTLSDGERIHTLIFSFQPVGVLSSMARAAFSSSLKALEPGVVFDKSRLRVSIPELLESMNPAWRSLLQGFDLKEIDIAEGAVSALLKKNDLAFSEFLRT